MKVVVADSSPIILLLNIARVELLHQIFGEVTIPTEVASELRDQRQTIRGETTILDSGTIRNSNHFNPLPSPA